MELRKNAHPIFEPQHKNKCYCTNIFSCRCKLKEAISSKPERSKPNLSLNSTSRHKFVKIRRENTGAQSMQTTKQNVEETLSAIASGPNSRCSSQCTTSHFTGRATPSENSLQVSESRHQLTDRRQQYERSKELINQAKLDQFNMCHIIPSHDVTHTLCGGANDRMIELQKFRMRNPNDCFNVQKQHAITMEQRLDDYAENFDKCKRDANFDKCLVDAVNKVLIVLKDGNKEFGIPRLEPLAVKSIVIDAGNAPINLRQSLKNILVNDLIATSRVVRYRTDLDKHLIVCDSKTDRLEIVGDYQMSGRILLLPITGSGKANITLLNTKIEHRLIGEPYEQDGVKYMRLKDYKVTFNPKRVFMHFENLFNDRLLSETMNRFLNENWETVFNELKVGYMKSFGQIFKDISNKIFTKVPFDSIFLS